MSGYPVCFSDVSFGGEVRPSRDGAGRDLLLRRSIKTVYSYFTLLLLPDGLCEADRVEQSWYYFRASVTGVSETVAGCRVAADLSR